MMAEYIKLENAIAIIEEKQKELCPVGRYGRSYIYGSDKDKYDAWNEIIDALENIPSADVVPVVHAQWLKEEKETYCPVQYREDGEPILHKYTCYTCSLCGRNSGTLEPYCHCGAKMDGGTDNEVD